MYFRRILIFMTLALGTFLAPFDGYSSAQDQPNAALLANIRVEFQRKNPKVQRVSILDSAQDLVDASRHYVLARGIRTDERFEGSFSDELFGLFVVDSSSSEILAVIDIIPTRRWNDYRMRIKKPLSDTITLLGEGSTYGDNDLVKTYTIPMIPPKKQGSPN